MNIYDTIIHQYIHHHTALIYTIPYLTLFMFPETPYQYQYAIEYDHAYGYESEYAYEYAYAYAYAYATVLLFICRD